MALREVPIQAQCPFEGLARRLGLLRQNLTPPEADPRADVIRHRHEVLGVAGEARLVLGPGDRLGHDAVLGAGEPAEHRGDDDAPLAEREVAPFAPRAAVLDLDPRVELALAQVRAQVDVRTPGHADVGRGGAAAGFA